MNRAIKLFAGAALGLVGILAPAAIDPIRAQNNAQNLQIYWIDVEGGAATLIVSPSGESLLLDTGFPDADRDAKRIYAAAQKAGLKQIDYLVISHWHRDHEGGLAALAKMIPIGSFFDHGDGVEAVDKVRLDDYKAVAAGKRAIVKPGDKIPLKGADVLVVSSEFTLLGQPVNGGGPNPLCADAAQMAPAAPENQRMVGVLVSFGAFTFLDLADLDWQKEMELSCPVNKVGRVSLYQTSRHGSFDGAGAPAFLGAISPQVIVVNNGPRKGLGQSDDRVKPLEIAGKPAAPYERNSYLRMAKLPGLEGIWQGHLSLLDKDPSHNTSPDMIANFEETAECQGNRINAFVAPDGRFTLTNGRNGFSKSYVARQAK
jgi:beta-lactamase superfamily II metal-dependent hydrolase